MVPPTAHPAAHPLYGARFDGGGAHTAHARHARFPGRTDRACWLPAQNHLQRLARYGEWMTVRELLARAPAPPRDPEALAFEAGCEGYCEREVDDYLAS